MLTTTPAIVLSVVKHNDKSSILHAYTRVGGRVSYIMYGHRFRPEPLSLVELTYDYQPTREIQTLKSISLSHSFAPAGVDISRQCVSMFVAEVLLSVFRHPMEDEQMYAFLTSTVEDIQTAADPENAHLRFLMGLSENLGFGELEATVPQSRQERQQTLRDLLLHFMTHCEGFVMPRSLDILTEIFD